MFTIPSISNSSPANIKMPSTTESSSGGEPALPPTRFLLSTNFQAKERAFSKQRLNRLWVLVLRIGEWFVKRFKIQNQWISHSLQLHDYARRISKICNNFVTKIDITHLRFSKSEVEWLDCIFSQSRPNPESVYYAYKYCKSSRNQLLIKELQENLEQDQLELFHENFNKLPKQFQTLIYSSICISEGKNSLNKAFAQEKLKGNPKILLTIKSSSDVHLLSQLHGMYAQLQDTAKNLALLSFYGQVIKTDSNLASKIQNFLSPKTKRCIDNIITTEPIDRQNNLIEQLRKKMASQEFLKLKENIRNLFWKESQKDFIYDTSIERISKNLSLDILNEPIKVTMVGVEFTGLLKQGGLAEAIEGMTKGLIKQNPNNKVRLIFPKYSTLPEDILNRLVKTTQTFLDADGKEIKVYTTDFEGVECFFIQHEAFDLGSDNPNIYGPNGEISKTRFIAFSDAATQILYQMRDTDIIHLHDWHVAGIALKMKKDHPQEWKEGKIPPVLFSYHNNNRSAQGRTHAGVYNYDPIVKALQETGIAENNSNIFVETLFAADMTTTVSESFARETQLLHFGEGVSFGIREVAKIGKLCGIINGTTESRWDPSTDISLASWKNIDGNEPLPLNFDITTSDVYAQKKTAAKQLKLWIKMHLEHGRSLKKEETVPTTRFEFDHEKPIVTYIGRFDSYQKGLDKFDEAIETTLKNGGQFILMGSQEDPKATEILDALEKKYPTGVLFIRDFKDPNGKFHFQEGNGTRPGIGSLIRAATDKIFVPSSFEPCGLVHFEGYQFGSTAIASNTGGFADTIIDKKKDPHHFNGCLFDRHMTSGETTLSHVLAQDLQEWKALSNDAKNQIIKRVMKEGKQYGWNSNRQGFSSIEKLRFAYQKTIQRVKSASRTSSLLTKQFDIEQYLYRSSEDKQVTVKKDVKIEEDYLKEYYLGSKNDEEIDKLYYKTPEKLRGLLPTPHAKRVNFELHQELGAIMEGPNKVHFSLEAPAAKTVELRLYDHDEQLTKAIPMHKDPNGRWKVSVEGISAGQKYHYAVNDQIKIDPYGLLHIASKKLGASKSTPPPPHSVVCQREYTWNDQNWMRERKKNLGVSKPMSIYEVHPTAWIKENGKPLNYRELAKKLVEHCKKANLTHVELMGLLEHPHEGSMGYQVTGYFAPNHRLGSIEDFKYLVNYLHENNIGVILDWVPAHFAIDKYGLSNFDGTSYFEPSFWKFLFSKRRFWSYQWGTYMFDYSKREVREFLISSAVYWLKEMHIDGLRVDAIRAMLDSEDLPATKLFLRELNAVIHTKCHGITIAEDYSGDTKLSQPIHDKGLGFDLKWNINWMHNMSKYFSMHPLNRKNQYHKLIESIENDKFHKMVLALSHDEVKKGMKTLLHKADNLTVEERYANVRSMLCFMMCLPGKKLNFMGNELGAEKEWDEYLEENKGLLDSYSNHSEKAKKLFAMFARLNYFYSNKTALSENDDNGWDLEWIQKQDKDGRLLAYRRTDSDGNSLACFHNFAGNKPVKYRVNIEKSEDSKENESSTPLLFSTPSRPAIIQSAPFELFNSDQVEYGGEGRSCELESIHENGNLIAYQLTIPPLSTIIIEEAKVVKVLDRGLSPSELSTTLISQPL